ncbi:uncharacterized protein MKZ38_003965 [Zalerion maritima]|uniref:Uncharacterized protein n=1 Tax=Zalerion maritima TaxID=339359 RepID=A0AAD5WRD0_9PEZI|nr:uncharacterized protein MKZ38_003965 [Zalerion maritima]
MDETRTYPELSQAEFPPDQEKQTAPVTTSRKRRIDTNSDNEEPQLKRARLTRKNLALFNKIGKKKASDSTDKSGSIKTTSTTSSSFALQARENSIFEPRRFKPPTNLEHIRKRHAQSRTTASPPELVYNDYIDRVEGAENEATMVFEVGSRLLKEYPKGYKRVFNQAFTGFPRNVGFNNGLSAPQPDFIEGLKIKEYFPFPVHKYIDGATLYKDNPNSLTLPQVTGEWKRRGKDIKKARL